MRQLALLGLLLCLICPVMAQTLTVVEHQVHTISSTILNESRTILVHKPADYDRGEQRYPVLYMLDGHEPHLRSMPAHLTTLVNAGKMPAMLLVSIQNSDRWRDFTPTSAGRAGLGGADNFLRFIEKEVFPLVEKNYRTESFRIFAGHSLGGLLVTYSMIEQPGLFNAYLAASPVLHWDNNFIQGRIKLQTGKKRRWRGWYYSVLGDEPEYLKSFGQVRNELKALGQATLKLHMANSAEDDHMTTPLPTYFYGLKTVWSDWALDISSLRDVDALVKQQQKVEEQYGFRLQLAEAKLNQFGYQLLGQQRNDEAIKAFKFTLASYPDSANAHDSLAEAYERNGQMEEALRHYQSAVELAKRSSDPALLAAVQRNWERALAASKQLRSK